MTDDRIAGTARNWGGKVQEGAGKVTGDVKTEMEGKFNQVAGAAEDLYGQAKDAANQAADSVRQTARDATDSVGAMIESRPYTAVATALAIGWLIGRLHRT
jgi:uncharacterized protein YjbJ (UPF0337 family)